MIKAFLITILFAAVTLVATSVYAEELKSPNAPEGQVNKTRQASGTGNSLPFTAGSIVVGTTITLNSGDIYTNCYFSSAPTNGTVTNGVIWPWDGEISGAKGCSNPEPKNMRVATGPGNTLSFKANTPVIGSVIKLQTGKTYINCYFPMAPGDGTVTNGVIFPWPGETSASFCHDFNNESRRVIPTQTPTPTITIDPCARGRCITPTPIPPVPADPCSRGRCIIPPVHN